MATKRIDYIDAIKGFSVLWVVLYHFDLTGSAINAPLRLPLFFLVSGLFFRQRSCFKDFFVKKVNTLLVPFVFFWLFGITLQLLVQCVRYLFEGLFEFSILDKFIGLAKLFTVIPINALEPNPLGVGGIWFLIGLFCLQMIYYGLLRLSSNKFFLLSVALGAYYLSFYLLDNVCGFGTFLYVPYSLRFLIFYVMGHQFYGMFVQHIQKLREKVIYLSGLTIAFGAVTVLKYSLIININILGGGKNTFLLVETLLFAGIVTIFFSWTYKWKLMHPFVFFGRNSIVIFGAHLAMFPFVQIPVAKVLYMVPNSWAAVLCFEFPLIIVVSYFLTLLLVKYFPMYIGKKELWRTA